MHGRRAAGAVIVVLLTIAACTPKGAEKIEKEDSRRALTPSYPAVTSSTTLGSDGAVATDADGSSPAPSTAATATAKSAPPPTFTAPVSASINDPAGDVTPSPIDRPPPWADLVGADLTLDATGVTLTIHLGGGQAPTDIDSSHTMNIGSFYDVNGDGQVDEEVWANLVHGGWGGAWFDDQKRTARFVDDSKVDITVAGDAVVLHFPTDHLANATTFRWSIASEWGSFAAVGTVAAARDDAPDNDQPAMFPG